MRPLSNSDKQDFIAYATYVIIALAMAGVFFVVGCQSTHKPVIQLQTDIDDNGVPDGPQYQIPVDHETLEVPVGWEDSQKAVEITVPPSDKETKVYVRPKKRTFTEKVFHGTKQDTVEVVSDNKDVIAKQDNRIPLWWWVVALIVATLIVWGTVSKYLSPITAFFSGIWALIARVFNR